MQAACQLPAPQVLDPTARDDLPYGPETIALMDRCRDLFTQLDHVEAGTSRVEIATVARAGLLLMIS